MAILGFELEEIARLIALVEENELDEFIVEEEARYLRVRGPRHAKSKRAAPQQPDSAPPTAPQRRLPGPPPTTARAEAKPEEIPADQIALVSPMVGVFYRAGKPGDPPFITIGQRIEVNQAIGVIEAMKIFSEVPADHAGIVVATPAEDGQLVQTGSPLVILKRE